MTVDVGAVREAAALLGPSAVVGGPLGTRTTYRVGGPAAVGVEVADAVDLARVAAAARQSGLPVLVVGRGSNLLVADAGFPGIVVFVGTDTEQVEVQGHELTAGAGVALPTLARRSVAAGLRGFEWAVGVPGSVGGAVRMNAGGHGSDVAASLVRVQVVELAAPPGPGSAVSSVEAADLGFGYRRSLVAPTTVVLRATFALEPAADPDEGAAIIREIVRWRRDHQPGGQNAGSVFTNPSAPPAGHDAPRSAGWLIDRAGLRGLRQGSAAVSDKHANFIQADPGGSADDVLALMAEVARRVDEHFGIRLHTENRLVGFVDTYGLVEVEG